MSRIVLKGVGAVSPAGWGTELLLETCRQRTPLPFKELQVPGYAQPLKAHAVPSASQRPAFAAHARLRRTSPIAQYAVAAALEALGPDAARIREQTLTVGIIYCSMSGCVNFSRRFYDETLKDPSTASPVVFPETVFNAPSSHLGALLGTEAINYTLVGDPGTFLQGLALAANWLQAGRVEACLVIGAEELDWLVAEAFDLFQAEGTVSEGAGAVYLCPESPDSTAVTLEAITSPRLFSSRKMRRQAALHMRAELGGGDGEGELLCDGRQGVSRLDVDEEVAWKEWRGEHWSPKMLLGEGFMAATAWQCVAAASALSRGFYDRANVGVVGFNQQAIAARFSRS